MNVFDEIIKTQILYVAKRNHTSALYEGTLPARRYEQRFLPVPDDILLGHIRIQ